MKAALSELHDRVPELSDVELCMFSESHKNHEGMLSCPECTPFKNESRSVECIASDSQKNNNDEREREEEENEEEEMEDTFNF